MDVSTVYMCQEGESDDQDSHENKHQDTENECETETEQCGADETQQCDHAEDHAEETEQWLSEAALRRKEWRTWNDAPLELQKDIERIHRNLGHASADQLEKFFRDINVSVDAISALKHFRCDACDRLKRPPSKRRVAVNHAETFIDIVSMDV